MPVLEDSHFVTSLETLEVLVMKTKKVTLEVEVSGGDYCFDEDFNGCPHLTLSSNSTCALGFKPEIVDFLHIRKDRACANLPDCRNDDAVDNQKEYLVCHPEKGFFRAFSSVDIDGFFPEQWTADEEKAKVFTGRQINGIVRLHPNLFELCMFKVKEG